MSLLSLLVNLMHPYWIKVLISYLKNGFHKNMSKLFSPLIIIRSVSWAVNQISEDWRNDAEYSDADHWNKSYVTIYSHRKHVRRYITICVVLLIKYKCSLGEQKRPSVTFGQWCTVCSLSSSINCIWTRQVPRSREYYPVTLRGEIRKRCCLTEY